MVSHKSDLGPCCVLLLLSCRVLQRGGDRAIIMIQATEAESQAHEALMQAFMRVDRAQVLRGVVIDFFG